MADENFEDDLFADLYEDDAKPAPVKIETAAPPIANGSTVPAAPEPVKTEHNDNDNVKQEEQEEEDDDDEIDFNLGGNSNTHDQSEQQQHQQQHDHHQYEQHHSTMAPNSKEDGKMFIGGLNWETTDQSLKDYFSQFGEVLECTVMRDGASGRSRGFGFLTFKDARTVNIVMVKEHYLDGKIIDPKRAIPRDEQERTSKIFVGGVSQEATEADFKSYFMQFGKVIDATLMMDKDTGRPRGFGFVTFDSEAAVENCLNVPLEILGKPIEVKKAQPRGNVSLREEEEGRGNKFGGYKGGNDNYNNNNQQQGGMGQMGQAPGGMTPQVMAQYWQRMQQYMQMMQQQMAMGRGAGMGGMNPMMNPMMMQQMQAMQAMQAQQQQGGGHNGRSQSPMSPNQMQGGMNPMMMNQMNQMAGGMGNGMGQGRGGSQGPGYNAYEQQQFEQAKYEQQATNPNARQRHGSQQPQQQQQIPQNFGGGGGFGQPTAWEGMYDDVPPPMPAGGHHGGGGGYGKKHRGASQTPGGPQPAPPAGAPTGPKNAGKPGANYRGGGRAGRGGFHPYQR